MSGKFDLMRIGRLLLPRGRVEEGEASARALGTAVASWFPPGRNNRQSVPEFLAGVPVFEGLTRRECRRLAGLVHERTYADGEVIIQQGTPGGAVFLIRNGGVEVFRRQRNGQEVRIAALDPGAFFGEAGLLEEEGMRWASARAVGPTTLLALGPAELEAVMEDAPATAVKILRNVARIIALRLARIIEEQFLREEGEPR